MKKKHKKTSSLVHSALAFAFIALFALGCNSKQSNATASDDGEKKASGTAQVQEKPKEETIQITAKDLTAAYEANEVAADNNYKEKTLDVTGKINQISKDFSDNIYVTLAGDDEFREVRCYFEDNATAVKLKKGMKVTFKGTCDGFLMDVIMKDCVLVN
jgi:hypothetical protein